MLKQHKLLGSNRKGFTLIELLVAMVLSFILVGAVYGTFTSQQKAYTVQDQVAETQQNARMAMNILVRDMRMAGYGMPDGGITIDKATYTNAIKITKNKNGKDELFDSITLVGAFGPPTGYLDRTLSPGSTELYLRSSSEAENFNSTHNRYIFIGGIGKLTVAAVDGNMITLNGKTSVRYPTAILSSAVDEGTTDIPVHSTDGLVVGDVLTVGRETITITALSEDTLTVDTDLEVAGNQGISATYPAGTIINPVPVFRVTAVEYGIDTYSGNMTREDKAVVAGGGVICDLAGNILDIQVSPDDQDDQPSYTVTLTARTRNPDPDYGENDGYRLRVLQSRVALRNL